MKPTNRQLALCAAVQQVTDAVVARPIMTRDGAYSDLLRYFQDNVRDPDVLQRTTQELVACTDEKSRNPRFTPNGGWSDIACWWWGQLVRL